MNCVIGQQYFSASFNSVGINLLQENKFEFHLKHDSVFPTFTKNVRPKLRNLNVGKLRIVCATNYVINIK